MTDAFLLRLLERVHGHLGVLAVAALVHPALVLSRPGRRALLSASLATGLVTVAAVLGARIYPHYRLTLKQALFRASPSVGWLFERKEHLAVGAVAFAWAGLVCHLAAGTEKSSLRSGLQRIAHLSFVVSAVFAALVAILGVVVATHRSF